MNDNITTLEISCIYNVDALNVQEAKDIALEIGEDAKTYIDNVLNIETKLYIDDVQNAEWAEEYLPENSDLKSFDITLVFLAVYDMNNDYYNEYNEDRVYDLIEDVEYDIERNILTGISYNVNEILGSYNPFK